MTRFPVVYRQKLIPLVNRMRHHGNSHGECILAPCAALSSKNGMKLYSSLFPHFVRCHTPLSRRLTLKIGIQQSRISCEASIVAAELRSLVGTAPQQFAKPFHVQLLTRMLLPQHMIYSRDILLLIRGQIQETFHAHAAVDLESLHPSIFHKIDLVASTNPGFEVCSRQSHRLRF